MKPAIPLPNQAELFCAHCQRFKPRALIVAVKWTHNGRQARYQCRTCKDGQDRRPEPPRRGG